MTTVTLEEAQARLPQLIENLRPGEKLLIVREGQPLAELRPPPSAKPEPVLGSCQGMLTIVAEDDDHLEDFAEYMP